MKKINPLVSDDSVLSILEISFAYQKSKILLSACELDIFSVLGNEEKTSKEIAYEIDVDEKAIDRLMNALCALNLLMKRANNFSNTKGTFRFLVKGQPEFIGNMMHKSNLWETWGTLTEVIRKGSPAAYRGIGDKSEEWTESYIESLHWRASLQAPDIVEMLNISNVTKMLDLGGASGIYAMEFVKANPKIYAYVFDEPKIITYTNKQLERSGYADKIGTVSGKILTGDYGRGYDLVFISHILSEFSLWDNIDILRKVYNSLNRGGQVVIQDYILGDDRISPETSVIHSLDMLVNTMGGDTYTETDIWIMLKEAWFKDIKRIKTDFESDLMIAWK